MQLQGTPSQPPQPAPPTQRFQSDTELVDGIIYLAGLVSQPDVIDKSLDTLRVVTASWDRHQTLATADKAALLNLQAELKKHLINYDRLRSFTQESLTQRLQRHRADTKQSAGNGTYWIITFASAIMAIAASFLIATPMPILNRLCIASLGFMVLLVFWSVWFYMSSLRNFTPKLRQVFRFICAGILIIGLQFIHFAWLGFSDLTSSPFYQYGGVTLLAFAGLTAIYLGLRRYAQILSLNTIFLSLPLFAAVAALVSLIAMGYAHASGVEYPWYLGLTLVGSATAAVACAWSAAVAWRTRHNLTPSYARSLQWLYAFNGFGIFGALGFTVALGVAQGVSGSTLGLMLSGAGIVPLLILFYSGYSFKKETSA